MKKYVLYLTEILFLIYIIIFNNVIINNFLKYYDLINILFFGILTLVVYFCYGFPRNKGLVNFSAFQTMIIWFIIYYTSIYLFGLFFGFVRTIYSLSFINIFKNIVIISLFYIFREMYRYIVIKQSGKRKLNHVIYVTILFILLDIIMEINAYDFDSILGIFKFIEGSVIPNIAINIFASYIIYKLNLKVLLLFLLTLKLPNYFMPLFPNFGSYLNSVLLVIFIFNLYYQTSLIVEKYDRNINYRKESKSGFSFVFLVIPVLILVGIISGVFKYHLLAIVSNSMVPEFARGDAVLIEKLDTDEFEQLEVGDILAFYDNDRMVVHRIIEIVEDNDEYYIKTKGDNNSSYDPWIVCNKDIYGKVLFSVKYVGIPSVELGELINR